jgi:hypothetical protein
MGSFLVFDFIRCREPYAFVEGETDNKSTFTDTVILAEGTVNLLLL